MNRFQRLQLPLAIAATALLAACAGAGSDPTREDFPTLMPGGSMPSDAEPSRPIGAVPSELLDAIVQEAAERAEASEQDVEVVVAERVIWNDGSIGCPEPGMMYTQALVPGYRVVVEVGGRELNFHAAESGDFRFCENPQAPGAASDR